MTRAEFGLGPDKKPDIEVNKPVKPVSFWQRPDVNLIFYILFFVTLFLMWHNAAGVPRETIPYSQFLEYVQKDEVQNAVISDQRITGTLKLRGPTGQPRQFATVPLQNMQLAKLLAAHGIQYKVRHASPWMALVLTWIVPFALIFLFWGWMGRRMRGAGSFLNIGDNRVHIHPDTLPKITFDDVAGVDEAKEELQESIEFLKNPQRIQRFGGHMPKGVLLLGAPGTGKTLLARAVAGEAGVPFFNISGAEFIEMFVGVGAARVRDLFHQAREKAPCIIFVDELDAIGRARGGPVVFGGHDEREQTLNQLLTEMDGFDPSTGVVVMAATNRPEVLDKALLRAGRFDRQIVVDKPDLAARTKILQLHGVAQRRDPAGYDGYLVDGLPGGHTRGGKRMPRFVEGNAALLVGIEDAVLLFGARHDPVDSRLEIGHRDCIVIMAYGEYGRLVRDVGEVGPDETRGPLRDDPQVDVLPHGDLARMQLQDLCARR